MFTAGGQSWYKFQRSLNRNRHLIALLLFVMNTAVVETYSQWRTLHNVLVQLDDDAFDQNDVRVLASFFVTICECALPLHPNWKQAMNDEVAKLATYDMIELLHPLLAAFYADVRSADSVLGMMGIIVSAFANFRQATRPLLHSIDILYFTPKERVPTGLRALIVSALTNSPEADAMWKKLPEDMRLFMKDRYISWQFAQIALRLNPGISEALAGSEKQEDEEARRHVLFID
ncbi:hypothetical protein HWV62_19025 [Athelia sp. TMB]|nr:hypothetical protein HWV62_19025 [Athelia sp. TMB]